MSDINSVLSRPIGKGSGKIKYPSKTSMNLYQKKKDMNSASRVIPTAILLAIFISLFTKFAVIDRLDRVNQAERSYSSALNQLNEMKEQAKDYDKVKEDYYRYTDHYMTDDESSLIERMKVIDIIEKATGSLARIKFVAINGNAVTITIKASALEDVSTIIKNLENNEYVSDVTVYNADKHKATENFAEYVESTLVFSVSDPEEASR